MMLPPDDFDADDFEPYDVPRGSCPRCGSNDIRHLVIGLPVGPEPMNSRAHGCRRAITNRTTKNRTGISANSGELLFARAG